MGQARMQRRSAWEWQGHIEAQKKSELNVEDYCREHGLGESSFYGWNRRLSKADGNGAGGFIEIKAAQLRPAAVSIETPEGYRIRVNGKIDGGELKQILDAMR